MNEATKRRRWLSLQFSLRTLFIVVTVFSVWLGFELRNIKARKNALEWIEKHNGIYSSTAYSHHQPTRLPIGMTFSAAPPIAPAREISWVRKLLGDRTLQSIGLPQGVSQTDRDRIQSQFPEATVWRMEIYSIPTQFFNIVPQLPDPYSGRGSTQEVQGFGDLISQ
jgi:hypothetical protein